MRPWVPAIAAIAVMTAAATADVKQFALKNRGTTSQGFSYGLQFDNLFAARNSTNNGFSGGAGVARFSMNQFSNTVMTVNKTGSTITINMRGTLVGGRSNNFGIVSGLGKGSYELDMTYTANILEGPNGWRVDEASVNNTGTLKALAGVTGVMQGTTWTFGDRASSGGNTLTFFKFGNTAIPIWNGTGWLLPSQPLAGVQQAIFSGVLVPLPTGVWIGGAGLLGVGILHAVRRRRALA
jgi:hypothetical protein